MNRVVWAGSCTGTNRRLDQLLFDDRREAGAEGALDHGRHDGPGEQIVIAGFAVPAVGGQGAVILAPGP